MIRTAWLWMLAAAIAAAQDKPAGPPGALEQTAANRTGEWDTLASGLELRIARLLPCDPRVQSAIEEVSRASDARLAAVSQYFQTSVAQARDQVEAARRMLANHEAMAREWATERAEAEQERAGIEGQTGELAESVKRRASLGDAKKGLDLIAEMTRQRAEQAGQRVDQAAALGGMLRDLVASYQSRQAWLEQEMSALATEGMRWSAYYPARLARARMECALTNPGADRGTPPRPQQKKRKQ